MKDFFTSFFNATKDRLSSAFFFNFLLCWCVINWEIFLALFFVSESKLPSNNIICYIKEYHFNTSKFFYKPLIGAMTISIGLPLVNAFIDLIKKFIKKKRDYLVVTLIDKSTPASPEDFILLKKQLEELSNDYKDSIVKVESLTRYKHDSEKKFERKDNLINRIKLFVPDVIDILRSDANAVFVESNNQRLPMRIITNGPQNEWNSNAVKYNKSLTGAFWIAHGYPISDREAIEGGSYTVEHTFNLDYDIRYFESISFRCLVDDILELKVNDRISRNVHGKEQSHGYSTIHEYQIKEFCKQGSNTIQMVVTNKSNKSLEDQRYIGTAGFHNPYGIIYKIQGVLDKIVLQED